MPDNNIHVLRLAKKLTKLELSVQSGVTNPLIARLESGKQMCTRKGNCGGAWIPH